MKKIKEELKLLLDENIGLKVFKGLQDLKWDVISIIKESPGISDEEVLKIAVREKRMIVTLDQDFGALVFKESKKHTGVILLRLNNILPENLLINIKWVLEKYGENIKGKFVIVSESRIRIH